MSFIVIERLLFLFQKILQKAVAAVIYIVERLFEITRIPRVRHVARIIGKRAKLKNFIAVLPARQSQNVHKIAAVHNKNVVVIYNVAFGKLTRTVPALYIMLFQRAFCGSINMVSDFVRRSRARRNIKGKRKPALFRHILKYKLGHRRTAYIPKADETNVNHKIPQSLILSFCQGVSEGS